MGLLRSLFGKPAVTPTLTRWKIAGNVASAVEGLEKQHGIDVLAQLYITISYVGRVEVHDERSRTIERHLAQVRLSDLPAFRHYQAHKKEKAEQCSKARTSGQREAVAFI